LRVLLYFAYGLLPGRVLTYPNFEIYNSPKIIHTPGHTPGHLCLYLPGRSLLIAGDLLRYDQGEVAGPVPGFTLNLAEAINSLKQVAKLPFDHMYGYHGSFLEQGADKAVQAMMK